MSQVPRVIVAAAALAIPSLARADVVNGSFESRGFAGWTVAKECVHPSFATAALLETGAHVDMGGMLFDEVDGIGIANYSDGLPLVAEPTHGAYEAVLLQNGPSTTRISQIVAVPTGAAQLSFDLAYHNWDASFSAAQRLQVQVRDADTDAVIETVFETSGALEMPMTHHTIDMAAFAGTRVRVQFELVALNDFFDVEIDNVDLQAASSGGVRYEDASRSELATETADRAGGDADVGGCSTGRGAGWPLLASVALVALRRRRPTRCLG